MKSFLHEIEKRVLVHDGSKGYMLQKMGLKGGECGEAWNIGHKDAVMEVYRSYLEAGADVIQTNTFPGNRLHLRKYGLDGMTYDIAYWGVKLAREAAGDKAFVCASIGPTGSLFEPSGDLTFEKAKDAFREQVKAAADAGADVLNFETFTDIAELRAAYFTARELTDLPVICSMAFETSGRTLMGTDPFIAAAVLKSLGADMVGANCSFGPEHMAGIARSFYEAGGGHLSFKPNAGLPEVIGTAIFYNENPSHFAETAVGYVKYGARLIGGCCGTTPGHIAALKQKIANVEPVPPIERPSGHITSSTRYLHISRITRENAGSLDASADSALFAALSVNDMTYVEEAALDIASENHDVVWISVDPARRDNMLLRRVVDMAQRYVRAPLILFTEDPVSLENALAIYNGVAGVAVAGDEKRRNALKEAAVKYGSVVVEKRGDGCVVTA